MTEALCLQACGNSQAVLMGTWDYLHLTPVPAARNSLDRMAGLLASPLCGWRSEDIARIENEGTPGDLADQLMTLYEPATNVALFYYVGHGRTDDNDQLCFGLTRTRTEFNRVATTSLQFSAVRRALQYCRASVKIVILDCCYSGQATQPHNSLGSGHSDTDALMDHTVGAGAYVMAASSPSAEALYEIESHDDRPQTYFTKYLADAIASGIAGRPVGITLSMLFETVRAQLAKDGRPVPCARTVGNPHGYVFARNAAPVLDQVDIRTAIERKRAELAELEAAYRSNASSSTRKDVGDEAKPDTESPEKYALNRSRTELAELQAVARVSDVVADLPNSGKKPDRTVGFSDVGTAASLTVTRPTLDGPCAGLAARLRDLQGAAGSPTPSEIARLVVRGGTDISARTVSEIVRGHEAASLEQTLAIARACCVFADETGRRLSYAEYDPDVWRTRYERAVSQERDESAAFEDVAGRPTTDQRTLSTAASEAYPSTSATTESEEIAEARKLAKRGRLSDAEHVLRREARNGSIDAMHAMARMYERQGRHREAERALRDAGDAGSPHAREQLERMNVQHRNHRN